MAKELTHGELLPLQLPPDSRIVYNFASRQTNVDDKGAVQSLSFDNELTAWYALRCKPNMEFSVWNQLLDRDVETYFPTLRVKPVNPRSRKEVPFFPGYLFVQGTVDQFYQKKVIWMPGALRLVSFDGVPAPIAETLISGIKNQVERMNERARQTKPQFEPGQRVWVEDGEMAGFAAVFEKCVNGHERVCVLLEMMRGRLVRVEVPLRAVQAIKAGVALAR